MNHCFLLRRAWAPALAMLAVVRIASGQPVTRGFHVKPSTALRQAERNPRRDPSVHLDLGESFVGPQGPRILWREPGLMVVRTPGAAPAFAQQWFAPGRPLAGYTVRQRTAGDLVVVEAPEAEKKRQKANPVRHRQMLREARAVLGAGIVNPVFVDASTGRRLIATARVVIALRPGVDAPRYFGSAWKRVRPVYGTGARGGQFLLELPGATGEEVLAEAARRRQHPSVAWAEPDLIREATRAFMPNDPFAASRQWHLNNTGQGGGRPGADARLAGAWDITTGSTNIVVAILDDGLQISHPDLAPNLFYNLGEIPNNGVDDDLNGVVDDFVGYDFYGGTPNPSPVDVNDSHGTSVAGLALAAGNNARGGAGAAYGCQLLPLKIIEGDYLVPDSSLAAALRYAAGFDSTGAHTWRGADVFNMSLTFGPSFVVNQAFTDAAVRGRGGLGCAIFAAAGNGASAWQPYQLVIDTAGTYTLRWEYAKDGSQSDGADTVWIDGVMYPDGTLESFENGTLPPGWTTGGPAPWTVVQDGVSGNHALTGWDGPTSKALRAGRIGSSQTNYVEVTATLSPGIFQFWAWVSTERDYDMFRFLVNGAEVFTDSGVPILETAVAYPASHPACFAVGACTDFDYRSDYSQYGVALDFVSPSDGGASTIFTTDRTGTDGYNTAISPEGDYAVDFGGTSAASPLAAGVAALVLSANPYLSSGDVRALMRGTCDRVGDVTYDVSGRNYYYGSGRINAARAVAQARADVQVVVLASSAVTNVGDLATYVVTVRNLGPSLSGPITLTNELPAGVILSTASPAPSNVAGRRLVFDLPALGAGSSTSVRVVVANPSAGTNVFRAGASQEALESSLGNNIASASQSILPIPQVSVADAAGLEGNSGTTNVLFNVVLSNPSASVVTVGYFTVTNTAGAGKDFITARGVVTFQPGETNRVIAVRLVGDLRNEADETFRLVLTNALHAAVGRAAADGTVLNDDLLPSLSITNAALAEGRSGLRKMPFKVRLSAPSGRPVTVDYSTAAGSARAGIDFVATNGMLTFLPGRTLQTVFVWVIGDTVLESNLTFAVNLSNPVNASVAVDQGIGTIRNDDPLPKLFIKDASVVEGNAGVTNLVFSVLLWPPSSLPASATFTTTNGTAVSGLDYLGTNGTLQFAPGETNQTITVTVLGDLLHEATETFSVRLSNLTNAAPGDLVAVGTIVDDDPAGAGAFAAAAAGVMVRAGWWEGRSFHVQFSTAPGRHYRVEVSEQLGPGAAWDVPAGGAEITGTGNVEEWIDRDAASRASAFYRVLLMTAP